LQLGHPRYLSPFPPRLAAGDLELAGELQVTVNGVPGGTIASGGVLELPGEPGRYDIVVGDGDFHASYDVESCGEPAALALSHQLESDRALRSGARPLAGGNDELTVCGATISRPYAGPLPILTRVTTDVETIGGDGELVQHRRPATPAWFRDVGLNERSRWEVVTSDPVWLVLPAAGGRVRVRLLTDRALMTLSAAAVARVRGLPSDALVTGDKNITPNHARERWQSVVALAEQLAGTVT
jgi:hypothetical protein